MPLKNSFIALNRSYKWIFLKSGLYLILYIHFHFSETIIYYFFCRPCSGLILSSYIMYEENRAFEERFATTIDQYKKYKKMFRLINENFSGNLFLNNILSTLIFKTLSWTWNWDMWGSILMPVRLTELQRTEQPSLWTCCQLLEEQWDSSLGSLLSVVSK